MAELKGELLFPKLLSAPKSILHTAGFFCFHFSTLQKGTNGLFTAKPILIQEFYLLCMDFMTSPSHTQM